MTNGLDNALQHIDILSHRDEQSERRSHIKNSGEDASPSHRTRQGAARILDLISHDRGEFEANQTEADDTEGIQDKARVRWDFEICRSDGGTKPRPHHHAKTDQDRCGDEGSDGPKIVNPLTDAETNDV